MQKLINFEFKKLFTSVSFYVCLAICAIIAFIEGFIVVYTKQLFDSEFTRVLSGTKMELIFECSVAPLMSVINVCAVFISLSVCSDFRDGTIKNIRSRGFTNTAIYVSKYLVSIVSSLIFILCTILAFSLCLIPFKTTGISSCDNFGECIAMYFLDIFALISFYYFVAISIRKLSLSILCSLFVPEIISIFLVLINYILSTQGVNIGFNLNTYWIYSPLSSFEKDDTNKYIIEFIVYILSFSGLGYLCSFKREIK